MSAKLRAAANLAATGRSGRASNASSWALACRLFRSSEPTLESALSEPERAALSGLASVRAVKLHALDLRYVLCPYCQLLRGQVVQGERGLTCRCPDCGAVPVDAADQRAWRIDSEWLWRHLRRALNLPAQPGSVAITGNLWRVGTYKNAEVIVARDLDQVLRQPALLARARGKSMPWLITPRPPGRVDHEFDHDHDHHPLAGTAHWWPLEERFTLYGGSLGLIDPAGPGETGASQACGAVHGPFSADFLWVHLPGEPEPIGLSRAQAAVFGVLWQLGGRAQEAHVVMARAGYKSDKPIDLFKVKSQNKGDPKYEEPYRAYRLLVQTDQRAGLYAMPCSALLPA